MKFKGSKMERKVLYDKRLSGYLGEYTAALVCAADNVGSHQMQKIREGLRPESVLVMGKNTLMKRTVRGYAEKSGNTDVLNLIPLLEGNVGLVFTKGDLKEVREAISKYTVGAPAKAGLIAPSDVIVPPGTTGLDPSQTSFFQAVSIPTKINKGCVEIVSAVAVITKGNRVGSSEAALLTKLEIRPFTYKLVVRKVYDRGSVFDPALLDLTDDDLIAMFADAVSAIGAVSVAIGYPTLPAASHFFQASYKNVLAVALGTDYSYPEAEMAKDYLKDPSKFAMAAALVAAESSAPAAAAAAEETKEEEVEEEEEEDDTNLGDIFGGDF